MNINNKVKPPSNLEKKEVKPKWFRSPSLYLGFIISFFLFAYITSTSPSTDPGIKGSYLKTSLVAFFLAAVFVCLIKLIAFILNAIGNFIRYIFHRPAIAAIAVALAVIIVFGSMYYSYIGVDRTEIALAAIQTNLTELETIKIKTDILLAKNKTVNWEEVASSTRAIEDNLSLISVPKILNDYRLASAARAESITGFLSGGKWKGLKDQPGDFRLVISDADASEFLASSVEIIASLKEQGYTAIKNKDQGAMQKIAASLLVQKHWLNGIRHSSSKTLSFNIAETAFAESNFSQLEKIPEVGPGCPIDTVVGSPTYGKCRNSGTVQSPEEKTKQTTPLDPAKKIKDEKTKQLTPVDTLEKKRLELLKELESYTPHAYSLEIRKVCFTAYNGKNFCIPEVIEVTTEIYESALNYGTGKINISKNSSWNKAWEEASDVAGIEPSMPTAVGGHEIPSDGAITIGDKDEAPPATPKINTQTTPAEPAPIKTTPVTNLPATWDGTYKSPTFRWATLSCTGYHADQQNELGGFGVFVENNAVKYGSPVNGYKYAAIDSSGYVSFVEIDHEYTDTDYYQFYMRNGEAYVDAKSISRWTSMNYETGNEEETICTRTGTAQRH